MKNFIINSVRYIDIYLRLFNGRYINKVIMAKSLSIILLCLIGVLAQFDPSWKITPPQNAFQMDYSPDQKFLAIANESHIFIYESQYGKLFQKFDTARQDLSSFAFNHDSTWLAVGFKDCSVMLNNLQDGHFVFTNKTYKHETKNSTVKSVCFTSNSQYVIIGIFDDEVVAFKVDDTTSVSHPFNNEFVYTVSCSPTDPALFVVGGGQNTISKFTFYSINGNISEVHDVSNDQNFPSQGSAFSADGTHAYRTQTNGKIYRYDSTSFTQQLLDIPQLSGKALTKIRVSQNSRLIATAYPGKVAVVTNSETVDLGAFTVKLLDSNVPSVALSPKGGHVLYISTTGEGQVAGECPVGKYSDNNGGCLNCKPECVYCDESPSNCFSCQPKYYLQNNQCLQCSIGCLDCVDDTNCTTCDVPNHFHIQANNTCSCDPAYFLNVDVCSACSTGCLDCKNDTSCNICKPEFDLKAGICVCKTGTYPVGDTCQNCIRGCEVCISGNDCETCDNQAHYIIDSNDKCVCNLADHVKDDGTNCICTQGYYNLTNVCRNCPLGCKTCLSASNCDSCANDDLEVRDGICKCKDIGSFIDVSLNCQKCNLTLNFCQQCINADTCLKCSAGLNRVIKNGKCQCDIGYFADHDNVCQLCGQNINGCLECENDLNCTKCDDINHWEHDPTNNLCKCTRHFYQYNSTCQKCQVGCAVCNAIDCLQCATEQHWQKQGADCKCIARYYQEGELCQPCIVGCLTCENSNLCLQCDTPGHFWSDNGICRCDNGYFSKDQKCLSCSESIPHCIECSANGDTCTKCKGQIKLQSNKCVCDKGKWVDDQVCKDCPEGCSDCNNNDDCNQCQEGYDLDDKVCKKNGIDTLIIVLIIVGVIVLAGAIFVVIKCIKKRKSPLSQDDYEQL